MAEGAHRRLAALLQRASLPMAGVGARRAGAHGPFLPLSRPQGSPKVEVGVGGGQCEGWLAGAGSGSGLVCRGRKGRIHHPGLACFVPEEKRNQEKYKAVHTLMKRETSRVIKPLKGTEPLGPPSSSIFLRTKTGAPQSDAHMLPV